MVAWPHVLEQDILVVGVYDRRVIHVMANQEAENEKKKRPGIIHPPKSSPVTPPNHNRPKQHHQWEAKYSNMSQEVGISGQMLISHNIDLHRMEYHCA